MADICLMRMNVFVLHRYANITDMINVLYSLMMEIFQLYYVVFSESIIIIEHYIYIYILIIIECNDILIII